MSDTKPVVPTHTTPDGVVRGPNGEPVTPVTPVTPK